MEINFDYTRTMKYLIENIVYCKAEIAVLKIAVKGILEISKIDQVGFDHKFLRTIFDNALLQLQDEIRILDDNLYQQLRKDLDGIVDLH